ncbi:MAG TPA: hypothetical protein PK513_03915 [Alphaproteobacteria bacterium]|nr:hypothetical protein [Alphaproteobacteria bacterium]USO05692.1 MAG: hypothetical protein H6859_00350 [Rhodospirillales bacterium]HOO81629.1 hypothetical protein [Alphaproteobacteria bacterium]
MPKKTLLLLPFVAVLSACSWSHYGMLEKKLDGKTEDEKRLILAEECKKEIERGLVKDNPKNIEQHKRMQYVCEEMTGRPVEVRY